MQFKCLNCGGVISEADIDAKTSIAKCPVCGKLFLKKNLGQSVISSFIMPELEQPARFAVTREGGNLTISYRWFSFNTIVLLFVCLLVGRFAAFMYSNMFSSFAMMLRESPFPVKIFTCVMGALPAAITGMLAYYTAAGFVNRTFIRLSRGGIIFRSGPLPWWGNKVLVKSDIELVCSAVKYTRKHHYKYYTVQIIMREDCDDVELPANLKSHEEALFIEQQANKILGLKERRVANVSDVL